MRFIFALATVPFIAFGQAEAQGVDFRSLTCSQLSGMPPQTIEVVAAWLQGHLADEEDGESMLFDPSDTDAEDLTAHCAQNPGKKVVQAADELGD
jgi:hypothetical protein